jgi:hypothetical protein
MWSGATLRGVELRSTELRVERSSTSYAPLHFFSGFFVSDTHDRLQRHFFGGFFFFFKKGPQWNIVDLVFFFLRKKHKKNFFSKKKPKKKKVEFSIELAGAHEGWGLPFPLARRRIVV